MTSTSESCMEDVISEIRAMVNQLLKEREQLRSDLERTSQKLALTQEALAGYEAKITALEEANKTIKIAKSLTGAEESTEAKLKINALVREIDKCIALLNK